MTYGNATALLTRAYGHAAEAQILEYLCIQPEEIDELYPMEATDHFFSGNVEMCAMMSMTI